MQVVHPDFDASDNFIIAGPLNLNRHMMRADTVMGERLQLSPPQFRTLLMLVTNEDVPIPFEELHMFMTMPGEEKCSRQAAKDAIINLANIVNISGRGFAKINILPNDEYSFETKWGMDWHSPNEPENAETNEKQAVTAFDKNGKFSKIVLSVAMIAALFVFIGSYFAYRANDDGLIYIPMAQIPLAEMPDFERSINFPYISGNVFYANSDFGIYIDTYNLSGGGFVYLLCIKMADSSTPLSRSILVPRGGAANHIYLSDILQPGRHVADLTLRAYCGRLLTEAYSLIKQVVVVIPIIDR